MRTFAIPFFLASFRFVEGLVNSSLKEARGSGGDDWKVPADAAGYLAAV